MHMTDMGIFDKEALPPFILKAVFKHTTDMSIFWLQEAIAPFLLYTDCYGLRKALIF